MVSFPLVAVSVSGTMFLHPLCSDVIAFFNLPQIFCIRKSFLLCPFAYSPSTCEFSGFLSDSVCSFALCWLENILLWPNTFSFMRFPEYLRKMSILSCWVKFSTLVRQTGLVSVRGNIFCVLSNSHSVVSAITETETVKWLASPAVAVGLASQTGSLCHVMSAFASLPIAG